MKMDTNERIYKEVAAIAARVFDGLKIDFGVYSAMEVARMIDKGRAYWIDGYDKSEKHSISVDGFCMEFAAFGVFHLLARMATEWKIETALRAKFTRCDAVKDDARAVVLLEIPKGYKSLLKNAGDDKCINDTLRYICVDTVRRALVASDGRTMFVISVPEMEVQQGATEKYLISPELFKDGAEMIEIYDNGTATNGNLVTDNGTAIYPDVKSVCKTVCKDYIINFGKSFKDLKKAVKSVSALSHIGRVIIRADKGGEFVEVIGWGLDGYDTEKRIRVNLPESCPVTFDICVIADDFARIANAENMAINSNGYAFLFGNGYLNVILSQSRKREFEKNEAPTEAVYPRPEIDSELVSVWQLSGIECTAETESPKYSETVETETISNAKENSVSVSAASGSVVTNNSTEAAQYSTKAEKPATVSEKSTTKADAPGTIEKSGAKNRTSIRIPFPFWYSRRNIYETPLFLRKTADFRHYHRTGGITYCRSG